MSLPRKLRLIIAFYRYLTYHVLADISLTMCFCLAHHSFFLLLWSVLLRLGGSPKDTESYEWAALSDKIQEINEETDTRMKNAKQEHITYVVRSPSGVFVDAISTVYSPIYCLDATSHHGDTPHQYPC